MPYFSCCDSSDSGSGMTFLSSDTSYYVASSGSDTTGTGSSLAPWETLQYGSDWIRDNINIAGYRVDLVMLTSGTYVGIEDGGGYVGGGFLVIIGGTTTEQDFIVTDSGVIVGYIFEFNRDTDTTVILDQCTLEPTSAAGFGSLVFIDGRVVFYTGYFGIGNNQIAIDLSNDPASYNLFKVQNNGALNTSGTNTITVPTVTLNSFYVAGTSGTGLGQSVVTTGSAWTLSGNVTINVFARISDYCLYNPFETFSGGTITAQKFSVETNGIINTFGAGSSAVPGSAAGTLASGGQII